MRRFDHDPAGVDLALGLRVNGTVLPLLRMAEVSAACVASRRDPAQRVRGWGGFTQKRVADTRSDPL